jgi:hypothetical protein
MSDSRGMTVCSGLMRPARQRRASRRTRVADMPAPGYAEHGPTSSLDVVASKFATAARTRALPRQTVGVFHEFCDCVGYVLVHGHHANGVTEADCIRWAGVVIAFVGTLVAAPAGTAYVIRAISTRGKSGAEHQEPALATQHLR